MNGKTIVVCYNTDVVSYSNYTGKPDEGAVSAGSETGRRELAEIIARQLRYEWRRVEIAPVAGDGENVVARLRESQPAVIFNLVEAIEGDARLEAAFAAACEIAGLVITGNGSRALINCLNKCNVKTVLHKAGILSPKWMTIADSGSMPGPEEVDFSFPVICKPAVEDGSIGISERSVVYDYAGFRRQAGFLHDTYNQPALIEEYIDGREFNISILNGNVLPLAEIDFSGLTTGMPAIVTYEGKWNEGTEYYRHTNPVCPAKVESELAHSLKEASLKAASSLGCRDYLRVDFRVSDEGVFLIDVNPNPDISPGAGLTRAAAAAGIPYKELILTIAAMAERRGTV